MFLQLIRLRIGEFKPRADTMGDFPKTAKAPKKGEALLFDPIGRVSTINRLTFLEKPLGNADAVFPFGLQDGKIILAVH